MGRRALAPAGPMAGSAAICSTKSLASAVDRSSAMTVSATSMRRQWMQRRLQPAVVSQKIKRGLGWDALGARVAGDVSKCKAPLPRIECPPVRSRGASSGVMPSAQLCRSAMIRSAVRAALCTQSGMPTPR